MIYTNNQLSFLNKNFKFKIINYYLNNQIENAKKNRWLFKYSILHRKIFKNSHKLTISKKLINSGLYNLNITSKNLWNSELLNKFSNNEFINSFVKLTYSNFLIKYDSYFLNNFFFFNDNINFKNNLNLLNMYEKSFFWSIKRFYFLNNLTKNINTSLIKFFNNDNNNYNHNFNNINFFFYKILFIKFFNFKF